METNSRTQTVSLKSRATTFFTLTNIYKQLQNIQLLYSEKKADVSWTRSVNIRSNVRLPACWQKLMTWWNIKQLQQRRGSVRSSGSSHPPAVIFTPLLLPDLTCLSWLPSPDWWYRFGGRCSLVMWFWGWGGRTRWAGSWAGSWQCKSRRWRMSWCRRSSCRNLQRMITWYAFILKEENLVWIPQKLKNP